MLLLLLLMVIFFSLGFLIGIGMSGWAERFHRIKEGLYGVDKYLREKGEPPSFGDVRGYVWGNLKKRMGGSRDLEEIKRSRLYKHAKGVYERGRQFLPRPRLKELPKYMKEYGEHVYDRVKSLLPVYHGFAGLIRKRLELIFRRLRYRR